MLLRLMMKRILEQANDDGAAGGGAPTPPLPTTPANTNEPGGPVPDFDFADLADHDGSSDSELETPEVTPPTPPVVTPKTEAASPPVIAPAQPPAPAATPPVAPPQQPPAQQQPAPASGQQPPPATGEQPPATPEPAQQTFEQHRAEFMPKLEKLYALSEQEVTEFTESPATALPKLAARLHYEVQMALHQGMTQVLPHMVETVTNFKEQARELDKQFYEKWPALKDPKYNDAVTQSIVAYKSANPKATPQQVTQYAGFMAMMAAGLPVNYQGPGVPVAPVAAPVTPAAPPVQMRPHRPAGAGSSGGAGPGALMVPPAAGDEAALFSDLADFDPDQDSLG